MSGTRGESGVRIGPRVVGRGSSVYVIAELGVNHDGDAGRALEMVDLAAEAGADAVKFQLFRAELLMSRSSRLAVYQAAAGEKDPREMLRRLELPVEALARCVERARRLGVGVLVTPFSVELVDEAERIGFDAYKTASPDIVHRPLLEKLAATGKPLVISTGASTLEEVTRARDWLGAAAARSVFLQCVSSYPTPAESAAIGGMVALDRELGATIAGVGYSDHTREVDTGMVAAQRGACVLEKHFTYSRAAAGPDHAASLEPDEFRAYAALARDESAMRVWMEQGSRGMPTSEDPRVGEIAKRVLPCERDVREVSRQSLVTARALRAGERISRADLTFKRPGTGLPPWRLDEVVGRSAARDLEADVVISEGDVR